MSNFKAQSFNGIEITGKLEDVEKAIKASEFKQIPIRVKEKLNAYEFYSFLLDNEPRAYIRNLKPNFYRIAFSGLKPLDTKGSLAVGGRFNIGGAQKKEAAKVHSSLDIFAAVYLASSKVCAKNEVGFADNGEMYKVNAKRKFRLLNLEKTVENLNYPNLKSFIDASPTDAAWGLQSIPMHSQLISAYFFQKDESIDGVMYPSTKSKGGTNYAIYERIGADINDSLKAKEL